MYVHVCAQKNERLTHLFMIIFLLALFPDLHFVVIICSSEFMCRVLFFIWALTDFNHRETKPTKQQTRTD